MGGFLTKVDHFRTASKEITQSTATGGVLTVVAYVLLIVLAVAELLSYMSPGHTADVTLEKEETWLGLTYDVELLDLPCKFTKVSLYDRYGLQKRGDALENVKYFDVDHEGTRGKGYSKDEIAALEAADHEDTFTDLERAELMKEWSTSSDHFLQLPFTEALTLHDFTMVNFYADWCSHCRDFYPAWVDLAAKLGQRSFRDADGRGRSVVFMRVNCVDFRDQCQEAQVRQYPQLRLYQRDGTSRDLRGKRSMERVEQFLEESVAQSHALISASHHLQFRSGCRVAGSMMVRQSPGTIVFEADPYGPVELNRALVNLSHTVHGLVFGATLGDAKPPVGGYLEGVDPLQGRTFVVPHLHEAPQHYLKVVGTTFDFGRRRTWYQHTHSDGVRRIEPTQAPQARFTYEFSALGTVVRRTGKTWYQFLTSLLAILGGAYTTIELCSGAVDTFYAGVKEALGKAL